MATRTPRNEVVSQVVADWLAENPITGTALVVDDSEGRIATELEDLEVETTSWRRLSPVGSTWMPDGSWDSVIVRLPKGREALEMYLQGAAARLRPGGVLLLCGTNDEGIKSAGKRIEAAFEQVETVETRRRCRVFRASQPRSATAGGLEPWAQSCAEEALTWISFPGVFANGRVDAGTRALLDHIEGPDPKTKVLDFGCGSGLLSLEMRRKVPGLSVDLLDIDGLAVEAARRNLPGCEVFHSDGFAAVKGRRWDLIVSNPPFHDGVARDHDVLARLILEAPNHLTNGGKLYIVCQRNVPVQEPLAKAFGPRKCERLHLGRYQVWRAIKGATPRAARPARR